MSNLNKTVQEKLIPFMGKLNSNTILASIAAGMMATLPLSLGTCIIAILVGFPLAEWTNWLASTGLDVHMNAVVSGTTKIQGLYLAFSVAYNYAKKSGSDGMTGGILSLASFIVLMPQQIKLADGSAVDALTQSYLGTGGIFVSMLVAIFIGVLYCYLDNKGITIKLPESVPEMVTKSLAPTFIAIIIFAIVLIIRIGAAATSFGNVFDIINTFIGKPIMAFGASPWSGIAIFTIMNIFWFFGIHPTIVFGIYGPVLGTIAVSNITAFQSGQALPYLEFQAVWGSGLIGGTGCMLGLAICMLFAKSQRFKALGKLAFVPSIFGINEPLAFGVPIIFNPIFFIPMLFSSIVSCGIAFLFYKMGAYSTFNPMVSLPWTMPAHVGALITTGFMAFVSLCVSTVAVTALYFPFFKFADKQALKEEQGEQA